MHSKRGKTEMSNHKYAVGVDFGTESGRALLVNVNTGEEVATYVHPYANGVIDEQLPESGVRLEPDWALQDPNDYLEVFKQAIPAVVKQAGVDPADVIGVGIDFTACTMLPTKADGTPLCFLPEFRSRPHAWVKLWKHHAAQPEANKLNAIARELGYDFLDRYGGKISSEWFVPKAMQILDEDPAIYAADGPADRGRGLGGLAVDRRRDAQPHHRGLQGPLVEAHRLPAQRLLQGARPAAGKPGG
jgi:L-ribulokinase